MIDTFVDRAILRFTYGNRSYFSPVLKLFLEMAPKIVFCFCLQVTDYGMAKSLMSEAINGPTHQVILKPLED